MKKLESAAIQPMRLTHVSHFACATYSKQLKSKTVLCAHQKCLDRKDVMILCSLMEFAQRLALTRTQNSRKLELQKLQRSPACAGSFPTLRKESAPTGRGWYKQ